MYWKMEMYFPLYFLLSVTKNPGFYMEKMRKFLKGEEKKTG